MNLSAEKVMKSTSCRADFSFYTLILLTSRDWRFRAGRKSSGWGQRPPQRPRSREMSFLISSVVGAFIIYRLRGAGRSPLFSRGINAFGRRMKYLKDRYRLRPDILSCSKASRPETASFFIQASFTFERDAIFVPPGSMTAVVQAAKTQNAPAFINRELKTSGKTPIRVRSY